MSVHKVCYLRYACSQNDHPDDSVGTHLFRAAQALIANFLNQTLLMESGIEESQASEKAHFFYTYSLGLYERIYADPDILKYKPKIYDRLHKLLNCIE